nr:MAG TPA: hypothetical protein [Caudoviricetes sp.]
MPLIWSTSAMQAAVVRARAVRESVRVVFFMGFTLYGLERVLQCVTV